MRFVALVLILNLFFQASYQLTELQVRLGFLNAITVVFTSTTLWRIYITNNTTGSGVAVCARKEMASRIVVYRCPPPLFVMTCNHRYVTCVAGPS